ncbi:MAG: ABC transporter substrate-binding protein [Methanotrichaceae archaeon]
MILALSLCLSLICGSAATDGYPRTITDSADRNVVIENPITAIVVLNSDAAEAVSILDDTDKIVGATDSVQKYRGYYFSDVMDNWKLVGTWKEFDYETIANLARNNPGTLLVISYTSKVSDVEENLDPFDDIVVVGLDFYNAKTMDGEITKLGIILNREYEAEAYRSWISEKKNDVKHAVEGLNKPRVYVEGSSKGGLGSLGTYSKGSALGDMVKLAGGENVITRPTATPKVEWESVLTLDPEVIIKVPAGINQLGWSDTSEMRDIVDEIKGRPGADNLAAVKDDRVYVIFRDITLGTGSVVGLTYWAKMLHPEINLDPESVYKEYLDRRGLDYPSRNVFIYPEI